MFKNFKKAAACAIAIGASSAPALANSWQISGSGTQTESFVLSQNKSTYVTVGCSYNGVRFDVGFMDEYLAGWKPNVDVSIVVDDAQYPVTALDGASDFVRLHTKPDGQDGVTSELLDAIASGNTLFLSGPATVNMSAASRSYSLKGSSRAIATIRNRCN